MQSAVAFVLVAMVAVASAGLIGAPGLTLVRTAPIVHAAQPIAYAHHAPVVYAQHAPITYAQHAPITYAHSPIVKTIHSAPVVYASPVNHIVHGHAAHPIIY